MFHVLAASAFLVLRSRWAVAAYLGVAVTAALCGLMYEPASGSQVAWAAYIGLWVASRALAPVVLVWLVVALRQAEAARHALATDAVDIERRRLRETVERAIGELVEDLLARGKRVTEFTAKDDVRVEQELRLLVGQSRRTLAAARQLLRGDVLSPRTELESAVALLRAAGVDAALDLPDEALPATLEHDARATLQEITNDLLRCDRGHVTIAVRREHDRWRVDHRVDSVRAVPRGPIR
jgi:hypothetical protein